MSTNAIEEQLIRIEAKVERLLAIKTKIAEQLDRLTNKGEREVIGPEEAMALTGCQSLNSQWRWFRQHGVRPYQRGKYIRREIENVIRRAHIAQLSTPGRGPGECIHPTKTS